MSRHKVNVLKREGLAMQHRALRVLLSVGLGIGFSTGCVADAVPQPAAVSARATTTYEVHADSPGYRLIQQWVAGAAARSGSKVGDSTNLFQKSVGNVFRVEVTRNIQAPSAKDIAAVSPEPSIPPWESGDGRMGDTATVNFAGGSWTQAWILQYGQTSQGPAWVVIEYHATRLDVPGRK